jgi:hypothetical protein
MQFGMDCVFKLVEILVEINSLKFLDYGFKKNTSKVPLLVQIA